LIPAALRNEHPAGLFKALPPPFGTEPRPDPGELRTFEAAREDRTQHGIDLAQRCGSRVLAPVAFEKCTGVPLPRIGPAKVQECRISRCDDRMRFWRGRHMAGQPVTPKREVGIIHGVLPDERSQGRIHASRDIPPPCCKVFRSEFGERLLLPMRELRGVEDGAGPADPP